LKIDDDHLYHGAALIQIAEHPSFKAINALKIGGKAVRVAYKINDDTAVYCKYAGKPVGKAAEYLFTFQKSHIADLKAICKSIPKTFVALVCVKDREICCLSCADLLALVAQRELAVGHPEDSVSVLVTAPVNKSLRVYVNAPGKKGLLLGEPKVVSRGGFPSIVFP
jgi:hypothetical protein